MKLFFKMLPKPSQTSETPAEEIQPPPGIPAVDYTVIKSELEKIIMGQSKAIETVSYQTALHLNKTAPKKPLSMVFYGSPGTGKSEAAKALPGIISRICRRNYAAVWTELNTFTEAHSVYRLTGSPPGYVGYDDKPVFEAVTNNPHTVFIFDELDKAHPEVLKTFMSILDEGRCASRRELEDCSREYDFRNCIFVFTSNFKLGAKPGKQIGFMPAINEIRSNDGAFEVSYRSEETPVESDALTKRIYRDTESARTRFTEVGVLREIASRFGCFVEFGELNAEAKLRILAKQVIETGFEYGLRLTFISSEILGGLSVASSSENALTVRSHKSVIEGSLAPAFSESRQYRGQTVRLEGTLDEPRIVPAENCERRGENV
jgi:ATP-dependent Clp protease ATP-binding subunit ClpA